ncbi:MAG: OsmC family protein [Chloroflexi bacterium]|nr:OsmC family protein [Chloroflexota bacterium]
MADELIVTQARSQTIGIPGRSLSSARGHHFIVDEPAYGGGPGEALTPAEIFLAGVSSCGVLLVQSFAQQSGVPLQRAEAAIEGVRQRNDPANFQSVHVRFELLGPTQAQAEQLVEAYKHR